MRTIVNVTLLVASLWLFTACPVSTAYPLGKKGEVKADPALLGVWKNATEDTEASAVTVKKGTEANTYAIHVDQQGSMFMANTSDFTGWLAKLNGHTFLVLQEMIEGKPTETYYVYHLTINGNKLTTNDISLKVGGTDAVSSTETYQEEVKASMNMEGFLAGQIEWTR